MTDLRGWSEARSPTLNSDRYDLDCAKAYVTHEGVSIYFRESNEKKRGVDGQIDVSTIQIVGIVFEIIQSMQNKIVELNAEIGKSERRLEVAYDLICCSTELGCDYAWQARELVERRANEIEEAKRNEEPA